MRMRNLQPWRVNHHVRHSHYVDVDKTVGISARSGAVTARPQHALNSVNGIKHIKRLTARSHHQFHVEEGMSRLVAPGRRFDHAAACHLASQSHESSCGRIKQCHPVAKVRSYVEMILQFVHKPFSNQATLQALRPSQHNQYESPATCNATGLSVNIFSAPPVSRSNSPLPQSGRQQPVITTSSGFQFPRMPR